MYQVEVNCTFDFSKIVESKYDPDDLNSWFEEIFTLRGTKYEIDHEKDEVKVVSKARIQTTGLEEYPEDKFRELCDRLEKLCKEGTLKEDSTIEFRHIPSKLISTYTFRKTSLMVRRKMCGL